MTKAKYTVTVVDTTGIQPYIFGSNRLQENIGASELVRLATGEWALNEVRAVAKEQNNVKNARQEELDPDFKIDEKEGTAAEVIYAGGGNTVVIFSSSELAREFARNLTRKALREAPGLSLVIAHDDKFDWQGRDESDPAHKRALSEIVTNLISKRLAARKAARLPSMPLLGLGVTAHCESTGLVATRTNEGLKPDAENVRLISREVEAKLKYTERANQRLADQFSEQLENRYKFPFQIDNLGRVSGEESYVAVVHADGNGMGDRIKDIAGNHRDPSQNRHYIEEMRSFSERVKEAAKAALNRVVELLISRIKWERKQDEIRRYVAERIPLEDPYLPFRPIVFGGDDITFVCNGLLGVTLAVEHLKAYEEETKNHGLQEMYASAGIAIVKMHYPFARAYQLSEELTKSAKQFVWEEFGGKGIERDASAFDWHIATSGLSGSLSAIRRREFRLTDDEDGPTLLLRPLLLGSGMLHGEGRAWREQMETVVRTFQGHHLRDDARDKTKVAPKWHEMRNKVKALREELRDGESAVRAFRRDYDIPPLPPLVPGDTSHQETGWLGGNRCTHFDAIELLDYYLHLPLDDSTKNNTQWEEQ